MLYRVAPAALVAGLVAMVPVPSAWAGGGGGHGGGAVFHGGGAFHAGGSFGGGHAGLGHMGGGGYRPGSRGLPPFAGVIHERPGASPYVTSYGHTGTALPRRFAGGGVGGGAAYGHTDTGLMRRYGGSGVAAYGHVATGLPMQRFGRGEAFARRAEFYGGRAGFPERLRFGTGRGRLASGFGGGFIGGYGGDFGGFDGGGSTGGGGSSYGGSGTYGASGTYGGTGTYGGDSLSYASETPLATTFTEPPLAPSPGEGYSPGDRYAYAASADVGPGPRIITVHHDDRRDCTCGQRVQPMVYRYGVGTAY